MATVRDFLFGIFKYHKLKLVLFVVLSAVFYVLMFPIADVKDRINQAVANATHGLEVGFSDIGLQIFPPGAYVTDPEIQPWNYGTLSAKRLEVSPSLMSVFRNMILGSGALYGLFGGDLWVDLSKSDKSKSDKPLMAVKLEVKTISLNDAMKYINQSLAGGNMSMSLDGKLNLNSQLDEIAMPMSDLPRGSIALEIPQLTIPAQNANLGGALTLPQIRMGKTTGKLNLEASKVTIEELAFGGAKDDLTGRIKGDVNLLRAGTMMAMSGAKLNIELTLTNSYLESISKSGLSLAFMYIDKCRVNKGDASTYRFDISLPAPVPIPVCL